MLYANVILLKPGLSTQNIKLSYFSKAKWTPSCCKPIVLIDSQGGFVESIFPTWSTLKERRPPQGQINPALRHLQKGLLDGAVSPDFQGVYLSADGSCRRINN